MSLARQKVLAPATLWCGGVLMRSGSAMIWEGARLTWGDNQRQVGAHRLLMSYLSLLLTPSLCLLQPLPLLAVDPELPTSGVEHRNQLSSKEHLPIQGLASSQLNLVSAELLTCKYGLFFTQHDYLSSSFAF